MARHGRDHVAGPAADDTVTGRSAMNFRGQRSFLVAASVMLVLAACGAGAEPASERVVVASASAEVSASLPSGSSSAAPPSSAPSIEAEIVCQPSSTNAC